MTHEEEGELYAEHQTLLTKAARVFARRHDCDPDDAAQNGGIGLLAAIRTYDQTRGVPFSAWASMRMHTAMHDGLRIERVQASRRVGFDGVRFVELDAPSGRYEATDRDRSLTLIERIPELQVQPIDPPSELARAIAELPPQWRRAVELYYFEDREQAEIAHRLGVSCSRVSQMLAAARARLAGMLTRPGTSADELIARLAA